MKLEILPDAESLAAAAATRLVAAIDRASAAGTDLRIALGAGPATLQACARLTEPAQNARLDWSRLQIFFTDEVALPADDPSSNHAKLHTQLLEHLPLDPAQVHRIRAELPPATAAEAYSEELGSQPLDLVLLEPGAAGQVAALFPDGPELALDDHRTVASWSPSAPRGRVSLSLATLNDARELLLLASGTALSSMLAEALEQLEQTSPALPVARIRPRSGRLTWLIDRHAAAGLRPSRPCAR